MKYFEKINEYVPQEFTLAKIIKKKRKPENFCSGGRSVAPTVKILTVLIFEAQRVVSNIQLVADVRWESSGWSKIFAF